MPFFNSAVERLAAEILETFLDTVTLVRVAEGCAFRLLSPELKGEGHNSLNLLICGVDLRLQILFY